MQDHRPERFRQQTVQQHMRDVVLIRADMTNYNDASRALMQRFRCRRPADDDLFLMPEAGKEIPQARALSAPSMPIPLSAGQRAPVARDATNAIRPIQSIPITRTAMTTITMPTMTALRSRPALLLRWALASLALLAAVGVQSAIALTMPIPRVMPSSTIRRPLSPAIPKATRDDRLLLRLQLSVPQQSEPDLERLVNDRWCRSASSTRTGRS